MYTPPPDTVSSLCWEPAGLYLASAGGADKRIRVWHNYPGLREMIAELRAKLPKAASDALKVFQWVMHITWSETRLFGMSFSCPWEAISGLLRQ